VIDFMVSTDNSGAAISGKATAASSSSILVQPTSKSEGRRSADSDRFNIMHYLLKFFDKRCMINGRRFSARQGAKRWKLRGLPNKLGCAMHQTRCFVRGSCCGSFSFITSFSCGCIGHHQPGGFSQRKSKNLWGYAGCPGYQPVAGWEQNRIRRSGSGDTDRSLYY